MSKKTDELSESIKSLSDQLKKIEEKYEKIKEERNENNQIIEELKDSITSISDELEYLISGMSIAIVADARILLEEEAQKIKQDASKAIFDLEVESKKKAEELFVQINGLRNKVNELFTDIRSASKNLAQQEVETIMQDSLKKEIQKATDEIVEAMIGDDVKNNIADKLNALETASGINKKEIYSVALNQVIDTITESIVDKMLSKIVIKKDVEEKGEVKPFDREKELVHFKFDKLRACVKAGVIPMLVGPAGTGKSTAVEQVARDLGLRFYTMNRIQNAFELTGYNDAKGEYVSTQFYEAYTKGGIFFFDEIDASSPEALVTINTAIAQGYMAFPNGLAKMHPDFKVVAAGNTFGKGANRQYCGRNSLDSATLDRFMIIEWDYDRTLEDKIIKDKELLKFAWAVREAIEDNRMEIIISTRGIIATSKIIEAGENSEAFTVEEALEGNLFENVKIDALYKIIGELDEKGLSSNKYYKALVNMKNNQEKNKR